MLLSAHKKGAWSQFDFLLIAFAAGLFTFYVYSITTPEIKVEFIGESQFRMLDAGQKAASSLIYIKSAADISLQQSIYSLAKKGGFGGTGRCGTYAGFNAWADIKLKSKEVFVEECYPDYEAVKEGLLFYFNEDVNEYFSLHPSIEIPGEYDYNLKDDIRISAMAKQKISVPIGEGGLTDSAKFQPAPADTLRVVPGRIRTDIETIKSSHPEVLQKYEELCRKMGYEPYPVLPGPCYITSGYRREGGARNSLHKKALAVDIYVSNDIDVQLEWVKAAEAIGFTGVGVYPLADPHIHLDLRPEKIFFIAQGGSTLASYQSYEGLERGVERYT